MKDNVRIEVQDIDGILRQVAITTTYRVSRYGQPEREFDCLGKAQDSLEGIGSGEGYEVNTHEECKVLPANCNKCGRKIVYDGTPCYCKKILERADTDSISDVNTSVIDRHQPFEMDWDR
tara:strand:- start:106 stop:465 length:360 start_codon:yes stop_codon:yes gene_type:complete